MSCKNRIYTQENVFSLTLQMKMSKTELENNWVVGYAKHTMKIAISLPYPS